MNIKKIMLMGRLTADPELQMSASNIPVLRFTVAVNRRMTNAQRDEGRPTADFIDCVAFSKTAEFVSKYFRKGSVIIVFGSLQINTWKDKDGKNQRSPRVVVNEVMFGESKSSASSSSVTAKAAEEKSQEAYSNIPENDFFADIRDIEEELPF